MISRAFALSLAASLAIHTLAAAPSWQGSWRDGGKPREDGLQIAYVISAPESSANEKVKADPVKIQNTQRIQTKGIKPQAFSPPPAGEAKRSARAAPRPSPAVRKAVAPAPVSSSAELLSDPKSGKIFSGYFEAIKKKIHHRALDRYSRGGAGQGSVTLYFILASDGRVDAVSVSERQSGTDPAVGEFAIECLKTSSPFPAFPKGLNAKKIAFSVTLLFEAV